MTEYWDSVQNNKIAMLPRTASVLPTVFEARVERFDLVQFAGSGEGPAGSADVFNDDHPFNFCKLHNTDRAAKAFAHAEMLYVTGAGSLPTDGQSVTLDDGVNTPTVFIYQTTPEADTEFERHLSILGTGELNRDAMTIAVNAAPTLDITASDNGTLRVDLDNDRAGQVGNTTSVEDVTGMQFDTDFAGGVLGHDQLVWGVAQHAALVGEKVRVLLAGVTTCNAQAVTPPGDVNKGDFLVPNIIGANPVVSGSVSPLLNPLADAPEMVIGRAWESTTGTGILPVEPIRVLFNGLWGCGAMGDHQ